MHHALRNKIPCGRHALGDLPPPGKKTRSTSSTLWPEPDASLIRKYVMLTLLTTSIIILTVSHASSGPNSIRFGDFARGDPSTGLVVSDGGNLPFLARGFSHCSAAMLTSSISAVARSGNGRTLRRWSSRHRRIRSAVFQGSFQSSYGMARMRDVVQKSGCALRITRNPDGVPSLSSSRQHCERWQRIQPHIHVRLWSAMSEAAGAEDAF